MFRTVFSRSQDDSKVRMISAAIATYKRPRYCVSTIIRLLEFESIEEIVVVGDNCPQIEVVFNIFKNNNRVTVLNSEKNNGPGITKNLAVARTKNDIVLVCDDDVYLESLCTYQELVQKLKSYSLIQGNILDEFGENRRFEHPFRFDWQIPTKHLKEVSHFIGAIHIFSKRDFDSVGGYSNITCYGFEELRLSIELIRRGYKIAFDPTITCLHYRAPHGRVSTSQLNKTMYYKRAQIAEDYFAFPLRNFQKLIWKRIYRIKDPEPTQNSGLTSRLSILELLRYPRLLSRSIW